jgi:hypothetical protein
VHHVQIRNPFLGVSLPVSSRIDTHFSGISDTDIDIVSSWGGVILSPLGTSAINWSLVPALDDR